MDPGPKCPNPPATANFKCSLFGAPINSSMATNFGENKPPADAKGQEFVVKIRISNGMLFSPSKQDRHQEESMV